MNFRDLLMVEIAILNCTHLSLDSALNYYSLSVYFGQVLFLNLLLFVSNNTVFPRTLCS